MNERLLGNDNISDSIQLDETNSTVHFLRTSPHTFKCLEIWLKICGYTMCNCYVVTVFLVITAEIIVEYWVVSNQQWYNHIGEIAWVITTYITLILIHRNLKKFKPFAYQCNYNKREYYMCSICFMAIILLIRLVPFITVSVCPSVTMFKNIISSAGSLIVNIVTMYSLNLLILYISLIIIEKYDNLTNKIKNNPNINITQIKNDFEEIQNWITFMKKDWELVVSISCLYHIVFVAVSVTVWITDTSTDLWIYCRNDEWAQLFIVIIRGCVRVFGLMYGILRMNRKPRELGRIINKYCTWTDNTQQFQIQRLILSLIRFPDGFKVIGITIEWRHFYAVIIAAITASLGSLAKSKFSNM